MAASDPTDIHADAPSERVDSLYGLPLDEFTPSRDALAKELRAAGQRQAADWVKGLRKPSAAAWTVNQLARTQAQEAKTLLAAGEQLRAIHERLLAGEAGADELRQAAEGESKAGQALLARAPGLLDREGQSPSPSILEKARQTVHAVALDEETRAGFAVGRLTTETRATGLGPFGEGLPSAPSTPRRAPREKRPTVTKEKKAAAREKVPAKGKVAKKAKVPAKGKPTAQERKAATEARARARALVKEAKAELRARQRAVGDAERKVAEAQREAERTRREVERATSELEQMRAAMADARAAVAQAEAAVETMR
jgi:hypothetical protein